MKKHFSIALTLLLLLGMVQACTKKSESDKSTVRFQFTPVVGSQPLALNTSWYTNAAGDSFRVTIHKYFVSNFSLINNAGMEVKLGDNSLLVDAAAPRVFSFTNVPEGHYTKVSFLIGVDSIRNVSGIQEGDLDPNGRAAGMFWDWNTGYIMAKTEGYSPQSGSPEHNIFFHIGGFSGPHTVLRRVTLPLPSELHLAGSATPLVHIQSDVAAWFAGTPPISFATTPGTMNVGALAARIADNYAKGYRVVRVEP